MPTHIRMLRFVPLLIFLLLLTSSLAFGKDRTESRGEDGIARGQGHIDWEKGVLSATGLGLISRQEPDQARAYLQAYQTAKMDALRNLLMLADQVQIDSQSQGANFEVKEDTIRAELKGRLRGAKVVSERIVTMGNGRLLELTVATTLPGGERNAGDFRPQREAQRTNSEPETRRYPAPQVPRLQHGLPSRPSPRSDSSWRIPETHPPSPPRSNASEFPLEEKYTSVIIDARGMELERSMSPKIRRANGSPVWGKVEVDPDWLIEHGIVAYAHSVQEACRNARAGDRPLILRAIGRSRGNYPSDPVLSNGDATSLLQANDTSGFLDKYRVIFVVDADK